MKIILSRKGFDSKSGGGPSPILNGRRMVSLPIEYGGRETWRQFDHLRFDGNNLGRLIEQLHPHRSRFDFCHLDPDLRQNIVPRRIRNRNWRPIFGQADKDATHLIEKNVGEGDIFLFFGLFRASQDWEAFVENAPEMHVIYGWFQVDQIIDDPVAWAQERENRWAAEHPHTYGNWWNGRNVVFLAKPELEVMNGRTRRGTGIAGAGVFETFDNRLQLSDPDAGLASHWRLPRVLAPDKARGRTISHIGKGKWKKGRDRRYVHLDPGHIRRWQEAVVTGNPAAANWAVRLIELLN